jgi:phosphoglycerate dehydrogenase-like enzyme
MLKEGRLAGAALDAFAAEPLPAESDLWDAANLLLTPHCSAVSSQTTDGCWQVWKENLGRFLDGRPLLNAFDKRRGY